MLKEMIEEEEDLRETCNVRWFPIISVASVRVRSCCAVGTRRVVLHTRIRAHQACSQAQIFLAACRAYRNTRGVRGVAGATGRHRQTAGSNNSQSAPQ